MTPTTMPREWDRVDDTLAGVIAFAGIDTTIDRARESLRPAGAGNQAKLNLRQGKHRLRVLGAHAPQRRVVQCHTHFGVCVANQMRCAKQRIVR